MLQNKDEKKIKFNFYIFLACLSLIKTFLLYGYSINQIKPGLIVSTLVSITIIFSLTNLAKKNRRRKLFIVYCIISGMLFADIFYYKYFGFMPSIRELLLITQIGKVKQSVYYALHPVCFLMIVDIPFIYYFLKKAEYTEKEKINRSKNLLLVLLMFTFGYIFLFFSDTSEAPFVFNRYGIYAYHTYDLFDSFHNGNEIVEEEIEYNGYVNTLGKNGKYYGIAKDKNVIIVQLESFQDFLINFIYNNQEITPNINKLLEKDYIYFDRYYQQVGCGNTSDCEFITFNSMHSLGKRSVYKECYENSFYSLPMILQNENYWTVFFHGNDANFWNRDLIYPAMGIDDFISFEDFKSDEIISFGLIDGSFFRQSFDFLKRLKKPYLAVLITLTSHNPYNMPEQYKNIEILPEHEGTLFADYIRAVNYTDNELGRFIKDLKEEGIYDDSLLVFYGDHSGLYSFNEETQRCLFDLQGKEYSCDEALNIPLIFKIPNSGIEDKNSIVGGQIDFTPTILNLLGIIEDKGIFFGRDLNNSELGFVANQYYVPEGSFIEGDTFFLLSEDGIFENSNAWNLSTGEPININECRYGYEKALNQIEISQSIVIGNKLSEILDK